MAGQAAISLSLPQTFSEVAARGPFAYTPNDRTIVQSVFCKRYPGGEKVVPFLWQRSQGHQINVLVNYLVEFDHFM